jgi:hypothetical protein
MQTMHPTGVNACQSGVRYMQSRNAEEEDDAMRLREIDIQDYARQLLEAHGAQAVAEAAQKACAFETEGNEEAAATWRHIEAALKLMRGPHES